MSAQTTLTENAPLILDATCSDKKLWPRYASIRMDIERSKNPDIVADAKHLPFRSAVFERIYCDPPHFIRADGAFNPSLRRFYASVNRGKYPHEHFLNSMWRYGAFKTEAQWKEFVRETDSEFARCLRTNGVLEYKVADGKHGRMTTLKDVQSMKRFTIIKDRISLSPFGKTDIHWLTMKPATPVASPEGAP